MYQYINLNFEIWIYNHPDGPTNVGPSLKSNPLMPGQKRLSFLLTAICFKTKLMIAVHSNVLNKDEQKYLLWRLFSGSCRRSRQLWSWTDDAEETWKTSPAVTTSRINQICLKFNKTWVSSARLGIRMSECLNISVEQTNIDCTVLDLILDN